MENIVKDLFEYSKMHHEESEAVIKIALLIMHCDGNITNDEINLLDRIIFITKFDEDKKVARLVANARLEILENLQYKDRMEKFIDDCVINIKTQVIINSLIKMAELIANSDKDYSDEEKKIINYLSQSINRYHCCLTE